MTVPTAELLAAASLRSDTLAPRRRFLQWGAGTLGALALLVAWLAPSPAAAQGTVAPLLASDLVLSTGTPDSSSAVVAFDGTRYLVIWREAGLVGRFVDTDGVASPSFAIASGGSSPALAFNGQHFLAVYSDGGANYLARTISSSGVLGPELHVTSSTYGGGLDVASDGAEFLVVWADGATFATTGGDIRGQRVAVNTAGTATLAGGSFAISPLAGHQFFPSIEFGATTYLVAWTHDAAVNAGSFDVRGATVLPGAAVATPVDVSNAASRQGSRQVGIAYGAGAFLVTFDDQRNGRADVYAVRVTEAGTVLDGPVTTGGIPVSTTASSCAPHEPRTAFGPSEWLVVFSCSTTRGVRVAADGTVLDATPIDLYRTPGIQQFNPWIAFDGTNHLVTWGQLGGSWTKFAQLVGSPGSPPVADAGPDQIVEATSAAGASVELDGNGSSDADSDPLTFVWRDGAAQVVGTGAVLQAVLPLGGHTFTLTVDDGRGGTDSDAIDVTVRDATGPAITVASPAASTYALQQPLTASYSCTDEASIVATCLGPVANGASIPTSSAGTHEFTVTATDTLGNTSSTSVTYVVAKAVPTLTWSAPAAIPFGTPLGAAELNATASLPGTFVYAPGAGTVLNPGAGQTLSVTFTPSDTANYTNAVATVLITVLPPPPLFQPALEFATGPTPVAVAVADFDGDGIADLVTANGESDIVSILLGIGGGNFAPPVSYPAGRIPGALAITDLDGDGDLDLAVANRGNNNVLVLLGAGDGTFQPAGTAAVGMNPRSLVVGDFNGDGKADLASANYLDSTVTVLMGTGSGGFLPPTHHPVGQQARALGVADVDGDGAQDLVVVNQASNSVSVLRGNGSGGFAAAVHAPAGVNPWAMAVGDFNGDRRPDLAVTSFVENGTVTVLLGNGDATFQAPASYVVGRYPDGIVAADLNGDGRADVAVANGASASVSALIGRADGTFEAGALSPAGDTPESLAVGEFNGDGRPDVAVINVYAAKVSVLLGLAGARLDTWTTASAALASSGNGQTATISALVDSRAGAPGGMVTFTDGATVLGSSLILGGRATLSTPLTVGSHSLVAGYEGDGLSTASSADAFVLDVLNTPVGSNVLVTPVDEATGTSPVTLTFNQVMETGSTSLTIGSVGPPPPAGFRLGTPPTYYELTTTATVVPPITICIDYTGVAFGNEARLKLFHFENGVWADRTSSLDTGTNTICAVVGSLSPFAVFEEEPADTVAPVTTVALDPASAWSAGNVTAIMTATDGRSGVREIVYSASGATALPEVVVPGQGAQVVIQAEGITTLTVAAVDHAGNRESPLYVTIQIDRTAPSVTAPVGGPYTLGQAIAAAYTCSDGGSGVASCTGTPPVGAAIDTATVGVKTFSVSASDHAGNSVVSDVSYQVTYGTLALYDQAKAVKSGATIPLKVRLTNAAGADVSSSALAVHAAEVVYISTNADGVVEDAGNANPDGDFRYSVDLQGYIFNLKTTGMIAGTWRVGFTVAGDPTMHYLHFRVR